MPNLASYVTAISSQTRGCNGAPDWIVDPDKNRITVYNFETEDTLEYSFKDSVQAGIYPGFCINFAGLDI